MGDVRAFADRGGLVLGICNGFQVLLELGLLPGAMLRNKHLKFLCRHVTLRLENDRTRFTHKGRKGQVLHIPIAHFDGNYYAPPETLQEIEDRGQVVFRYADAEGRATPEANVNGSLNNIAGLINAGGNVLGMMPHPERAAESPAGQRGRAGDLRIHARPPSDRDAPLPPARDGTPTRDDMIDQRILDNHNLTRGEYDLIVSLIGREPNLTELGVFSAMWSEHCSYKSSKVYLKDLPTKGKGVVQGPGENAGIIDIGDGQVIVFKIESHNHPSFIEPFQGAATGVGGILRDIFTMGARPIALLDSLRFGPLDAPRNRAIMEGVVSGISSYGNSIGVPTVGGEVYFDESYALNPLVNVFCLGLADKDKIFYAKAEGLGNAVLYVGSKTGRDGIHGATMASAEFGKETEHKRPNVQVGDPFKEKLLVEACLEVMDRGVIVGIQDMGAAGLTCSTAEMPAKSGTGIEIDLDRVPQREAGMTPYEILLSESQERMLIVARPGQGRTRSGRSSPNGTSTRSRSAGSSTAAG